METADRSIPAAQREAHLHHIISRLGLVVAFEGLIVLVLLLFIAIGQRPLPGEKSITASMSSPATPPHPKAQYVPTPGKPNGEELFTNKCNSCHLTSDALSVGPGLRDVSARIPKGEWKYKWVGNSQAFIASGDAYAQKLWETYKPTIMTPQSLTHEEIDAIFEFLDFSSKQYASN